MPYNIYCVAETWLSDFIFYHEILPCGYSLYRKDRNSRGGGVLIAVSDLISSSLIPSPPDLEVITVNVFCHNGPITFCTVYVPPNSEVDYHNQLLSYLYSIVSTMENVILVGDFNMPDICWSSLTGTSTFSNSFCDFVFEMSLSQLVMEATHIKGNILDLVLTNVENSICELSIDTSHPLVHSDHHSITFRINSVLPHPKSPSKRYYFDYSKADFDSLCDYLLDIDFEDCFHSDDVESVWSTIKSTILNAMNLFIPKLPRRSHNHPKWFNSVVRHRINCIRTLRKRCLQHPTPYTHSKLKNLENLLQKDLIAEKSTYEKNLIESCSKGQSSKNFNYLRSLSSLGSIPTSVSLDSSTAMLDQEKATLFNTFFHSVFTHSSFNLPPSENFPVPDSTISDISISELDVFEALSSLNESKSMGIDGI